MSRQLMTKLRTWLASNTRQQDSHRAASHSGDPCISMSALQQRHQQEQQQQHQHHHHHHHQQEEEAPQQSEKSPSIHPEAENRPDHPQLERHPQIPVLESPPSPQTTDRQTHNHELGTRPSYPELERRPKAPETERQASNSDPETRPNHPDMDPVRLLSHPDSERQTHDPNFDPRPNHLHLMTSSPAESEKASALRQASITSDYETMTSASSLTSETQVSYGLAELTSEWQTDNHSFVSPGSLSCPEGFPSTDRQPFFHTYASYPTMIQVCGPRSQVLQPERKNTDIQDWEGEQALARVDPKSDDSVPAPEEEEDEKEEEAEEKKEEEEKEEEEEKKKEEEVEEKEEEEKEEEEEEEEKKEEEEEEEEDKKEEDEEETFPQPALSTPIGALRRSRRRLCLMLNIELPVQEDSGLSPDYMGVAELLGFEALEIQNFWERNPSDTLFLEWARCRDSRLRPAVLRTLVSCLLSLDRRDVLDDCRGLILEDISDYLAERQLLTYYSAHRLQRYDCYVNIADADILTVGREIVDTLEGVYGLRLCLTLRDVELGGCEFDNMARILQTRCDSKVLFVLTRNYEDSDACQFLMNFATTLDPCSRQNKLIPLLVDEDAYIPRVIRSLARLNFNRDRELGFLWPRLNYAITR